MGRPSLAAKRIRLWCASFALGLRPPIMLMRKRCCSEFSFCSLQELIVVVGSRPVHGADCSRVPQARWLDAGRGKMVEQWMIDRFFDLAPDIFSDEAWTVEMQTRYGSISHRLCPWGGHLVRISHDYVHVDGDEVGSCLIVRPEVPELLFRNMLCFCLLWFSG